MTQKKSRPPEPSDVLSLAKALSKHQVQYVIIGGAAMAFHGFPRMTKDIDLLIPVDPENNRRLLKALASIPGSKTAVAGLRPEFMDEGYSTSFEGEISIDLLYVAAERKYEELSAHIRTVQLDGAEVATLDIDGMLISKETTREEDIPDRLKLQRLRTALQDRERQRRIEALPTLRVHRDAAVRLFADVVAAHAASGMPVDWEAVEKETIAAAAAGGISLDEATHSLCAHSPGTVFPSKQIALREAAQSAFAQAISTPQRPRQR